MKKLALWALAALNALLLVGLVDKLFLIDTPAVAQVRRPSEYLMMPGEVPGLPNGVVFMLDVSNGTLSMMTFDGRRLDAAPPVDLNNVFARGGGGGANAGGGGGGKNNKKNP